MAPRFPYAIVPDDGPCYARSIRIDPRPKFSNLSIAFRLLILLLAATPALALANVAFAQHFTALAAAAILTLAALGPQGDISTVAQLLKRFLPAVLFPVLWMTLQILPLPLSLSNPIWSTASIALGDPSLLGHVSIDPGGTIRILIDYLTELSLIISTAIIARDRRRAETTFLMLSIVTTAMSAGALIGLFDAFAGMDPVAGTTAAAPYVAMAALSALINVAIIIMSIERHLSRRDSQNPSSAPTWLRLVLALFGIAISLAAIKSVQSTSVLAATALGLAAIIFIAIVRRIGYQPWTSTILFLIVTVIAATVAIPAFQDASVGGVAGFATSAPTESLSLARRAMSDTPWLGNGIGTFRSLAAIYQDFGTSPVLGAPSTAISIAIEWGPLALGILVVFAFQLFVVNFRGAMGRGRDSVFASTAAAGVLVMLCEAFFDSSLLTITVQTVAAVIVGLGLSQSVGRTNGLT